MQFLPKILLIILLAVVDVFVGIIVGFTVFECLFNNGYSLLVSKVFAVGIAIVIQCINTYRDKFVRFVDTGELK